MCEGQPWLASEASSINTFRSVTCDWYYLWLPQLLLFINLTFVILESSEDNNHHHVLGSLPGLHVQMNSTHHFLCICCSYIWCYLCHSGHKRLLTPQSRLMTENFSVLLDSQMIPTRCIPEPCTPVGAAKKRVTGRPRWKDQSGFDCDWVCCSWSKIRKGEVSRVDTSVLHFDSNK